MSDYCLDIVHKHDYDRFLLALMVPQKHRAALFALFAFNYEIAKTREVVSETTIGLIRLQWWHEAIKEIYEDKVVRQHEVVNALAEVIKKYDLPREEFDNLIYAREFDLEGVAPANIEGLIHYADYTTTPLYRLVLKILNESESESILKTVSVQYAVVGLVRAVPYMLAQRRLMLPQDVLTKFNITEQKLFDFNDQENLAEVIQEILASKNIFRNDQTKPKSKFLKAVRAMSSLYTNQLESVQMNPYDSALIIAPRFMALRVWWASRF